VDADTSLKRERPCETGKQPTDAPVSIRRGNGGTVMRVIGGDPCLTGVAASSALRGAGRCGSWTGSVVLPEPGNAGGRKGPDFCALAYNLGNFMPTLAMPARAEPWSLRDCGRS
jgi:hypothetical protein